MKNIEKPYFIKRIHNAARDKKGRAKQEEKERKESLARESDKAEIRSKANRKDGREKIKLFIDVATLILVFATATFTGIYVCFTHTQLKVAKDSFADLQQSRMALVTTSGLHLESRGKGKNKSIWIGFKFFNSGDSPTVDLQWFSYFRCKHQVFAKEPATDWCDKMIPNPGLIPPKESIEDWHTYFSSVKSYGVIETDVVRKWDQKTGPEFSGWIAYKDVLAGRHRTFFCYRIWWSEMVDRDTGIPEYRICEDTPACADYECDSHPNYDKTMNDAFIAAKMKIPDAFKPLPPEKKQSN